MPYAIWMLVEGIKTLDAEEQMLAEGWVPVCAVSVVRGDLIWKGHHG